MTQDKQNGARAKTRSREEEDLLRRVNALYRAAAEEFARRAVAALGDQVDAIVLYGSVARGEAGKDSDVDILVVASPADAVQEKLSEIRTDLALEGEETVFISLMRLSRRRFLHLARFGYPLARNVLREGVALYDTGVFSRVRERTVTDGRPNIGRRQILVSERPV